MTANTKKCQVCNTKFEAKRSDAKYCSDKCKVKAHYDRGKSNSADIEPVKEVFYLDEYDKVYEGMGLYSGEMPLIVYCFFRRNLKGDKTVENIVSYMDAVWQRDLNIQKKQSYLEFEELFLSGKCEVNTSKIEAIQQQNIKKIVDS